MIRRLFFLSVFALVVAACGDSGGQPAALVVNGTEFSMSDVDARMESLVDAGLLAPGDGAASADATGAVDFLNALVVDGIVMSEMDERGLEVTQPDRDELRTQFDADPTFGELAADLQGFFIGLNARQNVLAEDLGGDNTVEQACGKHILVETEDEATEIILELGGGADFAELAAEQSLDTGSGAQGGDLGCTPRGQFVPPFEEAMFNAEPGELVGPVETDFGFHVIVLDSIEDVPDPAALDTFLAAALPEADVEVDPRYGVWNPETGLIEPPESAVVGEPSIPSIPGVPDVPVEPVDPVE